MSSVEQEALVQEAEVEIQQVRAAFHAPADLRACLDRLYALERKVRLAANAPATARVATEVVNLCWEAHDLPALREQVLVLSRRRAQLKQALVAVVQRGMQLLDQLTDASERQALLEVLRQVSEGKMFLELERARLTRMLAALRESEGDVRAAATVLQELPVETFGSMEREEKWDFLLEQVRLCLAVEDTVRAQIIANKFTQRTLTDPEFLASTAKTRYYTLMIQLYNMQQRKREADDHKYLDIAKAYLALGDDFLCPAVVHLVLAPRSNEQHDPLYRLAERKVLADAAVAPPLYLQLLQLFQVKELVRWPLFLTQYRTLLEEHHPELDWEALHRRITEHNLRVIADNYSRLHLQRLAVLLDLPADAAEQALCDEVVAKRLWARIDRVDGVAVFRRPQQPEQTMNDWSADVKQLMEAIDHIDELIDKERQQRDLTQVGVMNG